MTSQNDQSVQCRHCGATMDTDPDTGVFICDCIAADKLALCGEQLREAGAGEHVACRHCGSKPSKCPALTPDLKGIACCPECDHRPAPSHEPVWRQEDDESRWYCNVCGVYQHEHPK